jgi:seryl-tRNA synthetase
MRKRDADPGEPDDALAEAMAQIDALQASAADAEARAATAQSQLDELRQAQNASQAQVEEATSARAATEAELVQTQSELSESRGHLREAAARYRDARLASAPEIPQDLVPAAQSLDEIDQGFEAAQRVVQQLREKLDEETRSARVPAGSPQRRAPDLSGLSPAEKIKAGLQEIDRR